MTQNQYHYQCPLPRYRSWYHSPDHPTVPNHLAPPIHCASAQYTRPSQNHLLHAVSVAIHRRRRHYVQP